MIVTFPQGTQNLPFTSRKRCGMDYKIAWSTRHGRSEIIEASAAGAARRIKQLRERGAAAINLSKDGEMVKLEELPALMKKEAAKVLHSH